MTALEIYAAESVLEFADAEELDLRDRVMTGGAPSIGIVTDDPDGVLSRLIEFALDVQYEDQPAEDDTEAVREILAGGARTDMFGSEQILYWPGLHISSQLYAWIHEAMAAWQ